MDSYQQSVRQAGSRVFHRLTEPQRAELKAVLADALVQPQDDAPPPTSPIAQGDSWKEHVRRITEEVVKRKIEAGEDIDPNQVVEEIMPMAHAALPAEARRQLFAKIFSMTSLASRSKA